MNYDNAILELQRQINELKSDRNRFPAQETNFGDMISPFLGLPQLRGFWPISAVSESFVLDISGNGRVLSGGGGGPAYSIYNNIVPYADFNGSTQYLTRADEAGLSITGAMTTGGWFWFDSIASASVAFAKNGIAGQRGWAIYQDTANWRAQVSSDGTALSSVTGVTAVASAWRFLWMRYLPSTYIDIGYGGIGNYTRETVSIPAAQFDNTSALTVASNNAGANLMDGRATLCFVCATSVPDSIIGYVYSQTKGFFGL